MTWISRTHQAKRWPHKPLYAVVWGLGRPLWREGGKTVSVCVAHTLGGCSICLAHTGDDRWKLCENWMACAAAVAAIRNAQGGYRDVRMKTLVDSDLSRGSRTFLRYLGSCAVDWWHNVSVPKTLRTAACIPEQVLIRDQTGGDIKRLVEKCPFSQTWVVCARWP